MGCFRAKAWFCTGCSPLMARDALYESDYADVLRRNYPIGWRDKKINIYIYGLKYPCYHRQIANRG